MKLIIKIVICLTLVTGTVFAGNTDRAGEAGAYQLLINPWARSSGLMSLNSASAFGIEAMRLNVGGLTKLDKTQIALSTSLWWQGSDIRISSAGFGQKIGDAGVLGISIMSTSVGEIEITTEDQPEGTGANFRPTYFNMGLAYAHTFSNSISGGLTLRVINESISNVTASGIAIDAGILYTAGDSDNVRFGIALRNVGAPMRYTGDGLAQSFQQAPGGDYPYTANHRTAKYELPSLLNIGAAYDININENNKLTLMGNFRSNSFTKDMIGLGFEFSLLDIFMLRAGYRYEEGLFDDFEEVGATNIHNGYSGGFSVELPLGKETNTKFGLDYAYVATVFRNVPFYINRLNKKDMSNIKYYTKEGLQKLKEELEYLKSKGRADMARQIAEARDKGDLSENAEYDAAKEAQGMMEAKIAKLEGAVGNARILDKSQIDNSKVMILSKVTVLNKKMDKEFTYTIVSEEEADLKEMKISISSPIGKGLIGKKVGEVAKIKVPAGEMEFKVIEIAL